MATHFRRLFTFAPDGTVCGDVESYVNSLPETATEADVDARMVPPAAVDVTILHKDHPDPQSLRALRREEIETKIREKKDKDKPNPPGGPPNPPPGQTP